MQRSVVAEQLDVPGLQQVIQSQLITCCQAAKQFHGIQVILGESGHLCMTLTQLKVIFAKVDAEVAFVVVEDGDEEIWFATCWDFPLAVEKPGACKHTGEVWTALDDLIVYTDAGGLCCFFGVESG